jgi:hypothetical protein
MPRVVLLKKYLCLLARFKEMRHEKNTPASILSKMAGLGKPIRLQFGIETCEKFA